MANPNSLLVIGAGRLGALVTQRWLDTVPGASVLAETRTPTRHESLQALGAATRLRRDLPPDPHPFVIVAIPPSTEGSYRGEVERAARLWDERGRLLLISSTAVYAEDAGGDCDESSPLSDSPRAQRLLAAEQVVRDAGGAVLRLAGLYDRESGAHRVYARTETSPRRPDGLVNLVHYDDAAALAVLALRLAPPRTTYIGCDDHPISRAQLAAAGAQLAVGDGETTPCRFTATEGPLGRRCTGRRARRELGWNPRNPSFHEWAKAAAVTR